jgi:preprotein translocase subunit SecD
VAPPAGTLRVGRYFLALLALVAILYTIVFFGSRQSPKLGIDLVGGTQVIFTARTDNGQPPTSDSMNQARNILAERVNGTGVTQSTVAIQGSNQLVVSIPGQNAQDIQKLGAAAVLNFRGVVTAAVPVSCKQSTATSTPPTKSAAPGAGPGSSGSPTATTSATPSASAPASTPAAAHSGAAADVRPLSKPSPKNTPKTTPRSTPKSTPSGSSSGSGSGTGSTTPSSTPSTSPSAAPSTPTGPTKCSATSVTDAAAAGKFALPKTDTEYDNLSPTNKQLLTAALANYNCPAAQSERDLPTSDYVACDPPGAGQSAYLLGPVIVAGKQIDTASAQSPNTQQGEFDWSVLLSLKGSGQSAWANYTKAHNVNGSQNSPPVTGCSTSGTPCADYVAFTLDGAVISAPVNLSVINGQNTQITGNFNATTANDLANKLKYGALPLSFTADTAQSVSATLGTAQLKAGLLAGGIGLVLVVIYSLIYYRALGLVTIASLLVSGVLTYGALVMLSTQIGFTLSLAGIAGFIVAVGITADSFVVFFERLKDEVHEGRSVRVAVPRAWVRARRTILSADTVSFLAAAVLYYFTTDEVRGFAFTLGLSTILDLIVVFLFTHPMVSILSRSATFGSARFTGLDAVRGNTPAPAEPVRRERRERPGPEPEVEQKYSGVAVMEKPSAPRAADPIVDEPVAPEPVAAEPVIDEPVVDEPVADASAPAAGDESADDDTPRRRTTPEPGSAAERAAQRRARLRGQRPDEKGRE